MVNLFICFFHEQIPRGSFNIYFVIALRKYTGASSNKQFWFAMATKFTEHWQLDAGLLIPLGHFSSATSWNTLNRLCDIYQIEIYMHDHLSFSALFLGYNTHNHIYMPSNSTFHFEAGKDFSILQKFSTAHIQTLSCLKNRG